MKGQGRRMPSRGGAELNLELARDALRQGLCLEFVYSGCRRLVEVHAIGVTTAGRLAISAFQVEGSTRSTPIPGWRHFCLEECANVSISETRSEAPRPDYRRGDSQFRHIGAQI